MTRPPLIRTPERVELVYACLDRIGRAGIAWPDGFATMDIEELGQFIIKTYPLVRGERV